MAGDSPLWFRRGPHCKGTAPLEACLWCTRDCACVFRHLQPLMGSALSPPLLRGTFYSEKCVHFIFPYFQLSPLCPPSPPFVGWRCDNGGEGSQPQDVGVGVQCLELQVVGKVTSKSREDTGKKCVFYCAVCTNYQIVSLLFIFFVTVLTPSLP